MIYGLKQSKDIDMSHEMLDAAHPVNEHLEKCYRLSNRLYENKAIK